MKIFCEAWENLIMKGFFACKINWADRQNSKFSVGVRKGYWESVINDIFLNFDYCFSA